VKLTLNSSKRYLLQEAFLILVGAYLLIFASTHNGLVDPTILAVSAGLFSLFALAWLIRGQSASIPAGMAGCIFLLVLVITSFTSMDPHRSFTETWLIALAFSLYAGTQELVRRGWPAELFYKVILVLTAIVMGLTWMEVGGWYAAWLSANPGQWLPDIAFRLNLPNFMGVFLNLTLMLAIPRLAVTRSTFGKILLALWILSALGLVYLSSSRGGWLGLAAGLAFLAWIEARRFFPRIKQFIKALRPVVLMVLVLVLLIMAAGAGYLLYRQTLQPTHTSNFLESRNYLWIPAWNAFINHPLVGQGPFTFVSSYLVTNSVPPSQLFVYAHSIYLDVLSSSGLLGGAAFLFLLFSLYRVLKRGLASPPGEQRTVAIGAAAALAAFLVHGFFDSVHHTIPTCLWMLAVILGALAGTTPSQKKSRLGSGLLLSLLVAGAMWVNVSLMLPMSRGVLAADSGDWEKAASELQLASIQDPGSSIAYQQLGLAESALASTGEPGSLALAIQAFERTVQMDPNWALNHANLAALYRAAGDLPSAERSFRIAAEKAPYAVLYHLNLGIVDEELGNAVQATESYNQVLSIQPDWAGAYFWRSNAFRQQILTTWNRDHLPPHEPSLEELQAARAANPNVASTALRLAERYLQLRQLDEAARFLQEADLSFYERSEDRLEYLWLSADLAALEGNYPQAIQLAERSLDGWRNQGVNGPGSLGTYLYAQLMFRRPAMSMEMVPQMATIPLPDRWGQRVLSLLDWFLQTGDMSKACTWFHFLKENVPDLQGLGEWSINLGNCPIN